MTEHIVVKLPAPEPENLLVVREDGTTVAYFDDEFNLVAQDDSKATMAHIHKPDGTSIWARVNVPTEEAA